MAIFIISGGEGEIRTLGELPHDGFQDRYLKPLGHLSRCRHLEYFNRLKPFSREVDRQGLLRKSSERLLRQVLEPPK